MAHASFCTAGDFANQICVRFPICIRSQVIGSLIEFEHDETMTEAVARFKSFVSGEAELIPDLRLPCYFAAVEVLGKEGYDAVMKIYKESDLNEEMVGLLIQCGTAALLSAFNCAH
mmetsp:Transcript_2930/g.13764  ORF Transcript_2930/g.13764 Transcript_2930/m.13764 type:complete len:116 (-) Transcript_2930:609-956(-)